jgi:hypothetical protein
MDPGVEARFIGIENVLAGIQTLLTNLQPTAAAVPVAAPAPAVPAPAVGPALFPDAANGANPQRSGLRPNNPPVFSGDRQKGRAFLHAARLYARLVPENFLDGGAYSEEKLTRWVLSFMSEGPAQRWSERHAEADPYPFPTWAAFLAEFTPRFVEEHEQETALRKLESTSWHMRNRDVWAYTDDFEDLADMAQLVDPLMKATKYRFGLESSLSVAIFGSSNPPGLSDYPGWRSRAYAQYQARTLAGLTPALRTTPAAPARPRGVVPNLLAAQPRPPVQVTAAIPAPVPMDVDRTRARNTPHVRTCFRCGDPNHIARDCPSAHVRTVDILGEVIRQLGSELMEELIARHATTAEVEAHADATTEEDFLSHNE